MGAHGPPTVPGELPQRFHDLRSQLLAAGKLLRRPHLDGRPFGAEWTLRERPGLRQSRTLHVEVHGTAELDVVEIIRNNRCVHRYRGDGMDAVFEWTDTEPFETAALPPAPHWPTAFCFYYIRVRQQDGETAWVSPIWISP